jgi:hypothetical protein
MAGTESPLRVEAARCEEGPHEPCELVSRARSAHLSGRTGPTSRHALRASRSCGPSGVCGLRSGRPLHGAGCGPSAVRRVAVLALALCALTLAGGCIFVDAQFTMAPDGATAARLEAGVLKSVAEQGEGSFTADIGEMLAEGKWTGPEDFERGEWLAQAWEGRAAPGESLFVEGEAPAPEFGTEQHLLSTVYSFEMALPQTEMEATPEAEEGAVADPEMQAAVQGMMQAMMSTGEAGVRFSVSLPGEIASTNGEVSGPSTVRWALDPTADEQAYDTMSAQSRLLNWPVIGKLGGQLAQMGRWDLVPALVSGVRRGVLPDPVSADPMAAEPDALMYVQALEVMVALDAAAGEAISTEVLQTAGMNGTLGRAEIDAIAVRLEGIDLTAEVDEGVRERLLRVLRGE